MAWKDRQRPIEGADPKDIRNALFDWHHGMANAFSGKKYPSDYPLNKEYISYTKNGKHMSFYEFEKVCRGMGIILTEDEKNAS